MSSIDEILDEMGAKCALMQYQIEELRRLNGQAKNLSADFLEHAARRAYDAGRMHDGERVLRNIIIDGKRDIWKIHGEGGKSE